jgi:hypothetical protein
MGRQQSAEQRPLTCVGLHNCAGLDTHGHGRSSYRHSEASNGSRTRS